MTIESKSISENFQLKLDYIESKCKGVLLPGYEVIEIGYDEKGIYKVLLIGNVRSLHEKR